MESEKVVARFGKVFLILIYSFEDTPADGERTTKQQPLDYLRAP